MANKDLNTYVRTIAKVIIAISAAVLIGWQFGITAFKSVLPGQVAMNPFTALSFMATAVWQLLHVKRIHRTTTITAAAALALALFVFTTGAFKLFDLLTARSYAFDDFFYTDKIGTNRISQLTAFCFTFFGAAMLLSGLRRQKGNLILWFLVPVFTLALISFFGYVIGNYNVNTMKPFRPMAIHSTICFLALTTSFLLLFPDNVIMQTLLRKDSGGYIARSMLPYVLVVPFVISYIRYQGEQLGLYDTGFGVALFMVSAILIFIFVVVRQSRVLSEIDKHRREAEKQVKQRSKELERANLELERRNRELEQFAYAASHDMQEPLRKIHTFSSFLQQNQKAELDEKSKIYLSKIGASAERMQTIIDDLLNYSHYTRDDEVFTPTDLNTVIENIESDLELVIKEKSAIILKRPLPTIEAVPSQMHQLFYNLITNALKFSRPGVAPQVTISCSDLDAGRLENIPKLDKSKRYLEICVTDNGIGFDQSHADKIFNLFNRLHGKAEYSGTGIGLALCKKVAENHKGTIRATSEPGKGATFSVVLPAD